MSQAKPGEGRVTTISLRTGTKERFEEFGNAGQTHDEAMNAILDRLEELEHLTDHPEVWEAIQENFEVDDDE